MQLLITFAKLDRSSDASMHSRCQEGRIPDITGVDLIRASFQCYSYIVCKNSVYWTLLCPQRVSVDIWGGGGGGGGISWQEPEGSQTLLPYSPQDKVAICHSISCKNEKLDSKLPNFIKKKIIIINKIKKIIIKK